MATWMTLNELEDHSTRREYKGADGQYVMKTFKYWVSLDYTSNSTIIMLMTCREHHRQQSSGPITTLFGTLQHWRSAWHSPQTSGLMPHAEKWASTSNFGVSTCVGEGVHGEHNLSQRR